MIAVVALAVLVVLVAEVLVWAEAVINMLVEDLLVGVLDFAVPVSHSVEVVDDVMIVAMTDLIIGVLPDSGVDVLDTVLEFTTLTSLEDFRC